MRSILPLADAIKDFDPIEAKLARAQTLIAVGSYERKGGTRPIGSDESGHLVSESWFKEEIEAKALLQSVKDDRGADDRQRSMAAQELAALESTPPMPVPTRPPIYIPGMSSSTPDTARDAQVPPKSPVDKRSYRSVIGRPPENSTLACDDPIVLQNALEYMRVGDYAHYNGFLGYGGGQRRCTIVKGGSVVFATDIGQAGYRQVRMKDYMDLGVVVHQLWMRDRDLALCAEDDHPNECRPAKARKK